ncbi:MAG: hypothetical protein ACEY3B_05875 [Wolbachia sp.]
MRVLLLRENIPEVLLSCIDENDPHRESKTFQVERWCYANWDLCQKSGKKEHEFLAKVLSSEDCWEKENGLHGVKLNRAKVGKKLIEEDSPFANARYKIACWYCLEDDIRELFKNREKRLLDQEKEEKREDLTEYHHLVKCLASDPLTEFWSHDVGGYISSLNWGNCRHKYEYGLTCAMAAGQAGAVEFFWGKINSLPKNELSAQEKDRILKGAICTTIDRYSSYPEIFEFFFKQDANKCLQLYKETPGRCFRALITLKRGFSFDTLKELFDCLRESDILPHHYYTLLRSIEIGSYSKYYAEEGIKLFIHMWTKEGFDSHRTFTLKKELVYSSSKGSILKPLVDSDYMEPVWKVLGKASSDQIKEFMGSRQADYIRSVLKERGNNESLVKFSRYDESIAEQENVPDLSGDLSGAKVGKKTHGKRDVPSLSNLGEVKVAKACSQIPRI